jgi:LuxR family transcriptional regulator, regulator of acetate metabolism
MTAVAPAPPGESRLDRHLLTQVEQLANEANQLLELDAHYPASASGSLAIAASLLAGISSTALSSVEQLDKRNRAKAGRLTSISLRALELSDAVHSRIAAQRGKRYAQMRQGLDRLRRVANSAALLDRVCAEVVECCGFPRAMLTRVEGDWWLPWMAYFSDDRELEQRFVEWMNTKRFRADLGRNLLALRPVVVRDAVAHARGFAPMIEFSKTRSYVAAPISPAGRLVGVLYGDPGPEGRPVDEIDRDILSAFADDFGLIYARVVLVERMRAQRDRIDEAFDFAENMMSSLANAEIELARTPEGRLPAYGAEPELGTASPPAAIEELLTSREAEVLAMMVRGASNATIAEQLIIKEGTVKSHVKHILRKLDAVNRAEAISKYMGR